jgi:catechol 2,3-dioxygenase-like lactoylglutathione lyase family enzyme
VTGRVPGIDGLGHFGITVPDLGAAIEFFEGALGFETLSVHELEASKAEMAAWFGVESRARARFAFMRLDADALVELIEWRVPGRDDSVPALTDAGGTHLALWVEDLDKAIALLECHSEVKVFQAHPDRFVYVRSPWGLYVQLMAR